MLSAAKDGDVESIVASLKEGFSPDAANGIGQKALHVAAIWDQTAVSALLINAGADVNVKNQFGETPLSYAVKGNHERTVRLLLENGAKIEKQMIAAAKGEVQELLLNPPSKLMNQAIKNLDMPRLRDMIDKGGDVMECDSRGSTPFHYAALAALAIEASARQEKRKPKKGGQNKGIDTLDALNMLVLEAQRRDGSMVRRACRELDDEGNSPLHLLVQATDWP